MTHALYLKTTNDTNGNPRRGWLISSHLSSLEAFIDEDYAGARESLRDGLSLLVSKCGDIEHWFSPRINNLGINVSPGEFRRIRKLAKDKGTLV